MSELEKILEEIDGSIKEYMTGDVPFGMHDFCAGMKYTLELIRNKMDNGWIPAEERLPDESLNSVIGWDDYRKRCCFVQYYNGRWILGNGIEPVKIIAWRPLPEDFSPKRSNENAGK